MARGGRGHGLSAPLRRPTFRRLATSYAVNELGDWIGVVALSVLVFDETGSAIATAALFLGTRFLPTLLAPFLVSRSERPRPRFALPVIYCAEAAAFGALALLAVDFSLPAVIAVATLDGALALTGRSLSRAVVAEMLENAGELRAGNALLNVAFTGGAAIGPALAGVLVAQLGVQAALLVNAVSFYVVAWILLRTGLMPRVTPDPGRIVDRVRLGLAYIRHRAPLRRLFVAQGLAFVFFAVVIPIEVIYAKETLGSGDLGYGLLLASWGLGMVVGSVIFAAARHAPLAHLLLLSTAAVAVGYLGIGAAPTLALACIASIVGGVGNGVQWVSLVSAVQELTKQEMQARVLSVLESLGAAMPGIGFALGGLVSTAAGPRTAFFVAGVGILAILAASVPLLRPLSLESDHEAERLKAAETAPIARMPLSALVDSSSTQPQDVGSELELFWLLLGFGGSVGTSAGFAEHSVTLGLIWGIVAAFCSALAIALVFRIPGVKTLIVRVMRWIRRG